MHAPLCTGLRSPLLPSLLDGAYQPAQLEEQLEQQCSNLINRAEVVQLIDRNKLQVPEWMEWYKNDFEPHGGLLTFINQYRKQSYPAATKLSYAPYDWRLNDIPSAIMRATPQSFRGLDFVESRATRAQSIQFCLYPKRV